MADINQSVVNKSQKPNTHNGHPHNHLAPHSRMKEVENSFSFLRGFSLKNWFFFLSVDHKSYLDVCSFFLTYWLKCITFWFWWLRFIFMDCQCVNPLQIIQFSSLSLFAPFTKRTFNLISHPSHINNLQHLHDFSAIAN